MFTIRPITDSDRPWMRKLWIEKWSALFVVSKEGTIHHLDDAKGFVAKQGDTPVGLITYAVANNECEITSLHSINECQGIGTQLLQRIENKALDARWRRIWVITTNDNLDALRFYQKRGYRLVAVYRDAMDVVRTLKPGLPKLGRDGIPLRDEIELEKILEPSI